MKKVCVDHSLCLTQTSLVTCVTFYWCHLLFAIRVITLLGIQFGASYVVFRSSRNSVLYTHTLSHTQTLTHTLRCTGRCRAAPLMPLLPSGPAASWHLSPWRRLIASPVLTRGERHAEREKPSLHPFICLLQWWPSPPFSFVLRTPLRPLYSAFYVPINAIPFHQKPEKWNGTKSDRSTVSNLAENVTHASEHKILPRPSHWPQSKSEEAYLNPASVMVSCSESRRKFAPFFPSNKSIVLSVTVCSPLMENSPCTRIDIMFLLWSFWVNECSWTRARLPESIEPRLI